ncbi:MAG: hypothetical protein IK008_07430 [Bacteroidales bacterium]|nr:hypothetical protein [Bacteroidales bacterium]
MKKVLIALTAVALIAATASCKCGKKAEAPAEGKNAEAVTATNGDDNAPAEEENAEEISKPIKKLIKLTDKGLALQEKVEKLDIEKDADKLEELSAKAEELVEELKALQEKYEDYELTDADREALVNYAIEVMKRQGEEVSDDAKKALQEEFAKYKTFSDIDL